MNEERIYKVSYEDTGLRLDCYLSLKEKHLSRSYLQSLIQEGMVKVGGRKRKKSYLLSQGDEVLLYLPEPTDPTPVPQKIPLSILYQDSSLIVVNKEAGLVVHPAPGHPQGTLVNALLYHCPDLVGIGGVKRPGIVHRLDKDTSGVMVVAKEDGVHQDLKEQFSKRSIQKIYLALVEGHFFPDKALVDAPIGRDPRYRQRMTVASQGKSAISYFTVKRRFKDTTLLQVRLKTGRMHQIRVHASYLGFSVVGDLLYGRKDHRKEVQRQLLHSFCLGFFHPKTREWMEFRAPLPPDFLAFLKKEWST